MDDNIRKELEQEEVSEWHAQLLQHCRNLTEMSRRYMSAYYPRWDKADDTYRGLRLPDKADAMADARQEPQRMVVPLTYAQIQTFVSFCITLFTQREHLFELIGTGEEDHKAAKLGEALLARDLTKNVFESKLYQFLIDLCRFGMGVLKTTWVEEKVMKQVMEQQGGLNIFGLQLKAPAAVEVEKEVVSFQGNRIYNISPYKFFPDVRLPLGRMQEGEFITSEEQYSMVQMHQFQHDGLIAGMQYVKPFTMKDLDARTVSTRLSKATPLSDISSSVRALQSTGVCILDECQVKLIPCKFKVAGEPMGPEDYPVMYNIWYVNDKRVVKAEPMNFNHNQFSYDVAEFSPDMHNLINQGLAETIDNLQAVVSWLVNSHITSVRKVIQNLFIVDPAGVEMEDLRDRKPVIRLKPDMARKGVDNFIKQLAVTDVTGNHMTDAQAIQTTVQVVTGINDNALGQFHTGRRSATEARNVNSATASRLKMQALLIYRTALETMARKMISNHQQGLTEETFVRVVGELADPATFQQFVKVTKGDLQGDYDFEIFDGTLPSERGERAAALEEFMVAMMKSPEMVSILGYDPMKLVEEWLELRGIRNPKRFLMDQVRQQQLAMQVQQMNGKAPIGQEPTSGLPAGPGGATSGGGAGQLGGTGAVPLNPAGATPGGGQLAGVSGGEAITQLLAAGGGK
jgi:hypothetical protein